MPVNEEVFHAAVSFLGFVQMEGCVERYPDEVKALLQCGIKSTVLDNILQEERDNWARWGKSGELSEIWREILE